MYDIFFVSKFNSEEFQKLKVRYPRARFLENINSFDDLKKRSFTKMFWVVWDDIVLAESFDLDSYRATEWDDMYVHVFKNGAHNDGLCLFPKNLDVSDREWKNRYFINKKETEIVASEPLRFKKYDLISYEQYEEIIEQSSDMFWGKWPDTEILDESVFNLYFNHHNSYDRNENHVFKNLSAGEESYKHGLVLFSKNKKISKREFDQQYLVDKKEHELVATRSAYPRYTINTFEEYQSLLNTVNEMFWCVWPNVNVIDQTVFNLYFEPSNGVHDHDRRENHVFRNFCNEKESYLNGIVLFSKHKPISKKEFDRRYLIDKKEHDLAVSRFRYPKINLTDYDSYLQFLKRIDSDLFWGVWPNIEITDETIFDFYYDPNDGRYDHDRKENHVFLNACDQTQSFLSGIVLFSKHKPISNREFDVRYLIDKKEHDRVVSRFRYPRYQIDTYDDYDRIRNEVDSEMFWAIWPEISIDDETVFDLYFDSKNGKYDFDRNINHVFRHKLRSDEESYNGLVLFSKEVPVSKKEIEYRYIIHKKEHTNIVSSHRPYDIVFISYNEPNAEDNWENLKSRFPRAKRIHGIKGIHNAHIAAATLAETDMFYVVDGDAIIESNFDFSYTCSGYERKTVHVWRSRNPINNLEYGYGGVKLLPRKLTLVMNTESHDMTTSISEQFKVMPAVSNITAFNTDPFNTWKSAFRECAKLSSKTIRGQINDETEERLKQWCSVGEDALYGQYSIAGGIAGRDYGYANRDNPDQLKLINDFDWLREQYGS